MTRPILLLTLAALAAHGAETWGQFRGANGAGIGEGTGYPVEFSPSKNVAWKTAVPFGQSSPVLAAGRIYLTASEPGKLLTLALDEKTGKELWRREIPKETFTKIYKPNDPASPTPAADAEGVVAFFADFGLIAYDQNGKERWKKPMGPFQNFYGMASSPVIAGNMVIQVVDEQKAPYVIALDRKTGAQRWKTPRQAGVGWSTPVVYRPAKGPAQLIVLGSLRVDGYFLDTGESKWWMRIASSGGLGTPLVKGDTLYFSTLGGGEPWMPTFEARGKPLDKDNDGKLSAAEFAADKEFGDQFGWLDIDTDGFITEKEWNYGRSMALGESGVVAFQPDVAQGQIDPLKVKWRFKKNLPFIAAPLLYGDVLYMVRDGGIITSLEAATGNQLKAGRNPQALGEYHASIVAADGKLYLANVEGKVSVLRAAGDWEVLATNDIGDEIHATPALSGGRIYIRTRGHLYCFAQPQ